MRQVSQESQLLSLITLDFVTKCLSQYVCLNVAIFEHIVSDCMYQVKRPIKDKQRTNKMSKTETYDLDFAREAAINLTLKRVQHELDIMIEKLGKHKDFAEIANGIQIAKIKLADLTVEQIEEDI